MTKKEEKSVGKKIAYGVAIAGIAVGLGFGAVANNVNKDNKELAKDLSGLQESVLDLQSQLANNQLTLEEYEAQIATLGAQVVDLEALSEADKAVIADYEAEIEALQEEVTAQEAVAAEEAVDTYEKDDLKLTFADEVKVDSKDLEKLGDYEIDFDGEDIDVEETITISGAFASNDKDFNGETMYKLPEGSVEYKVSFSEDMSALDYDEDKATFTILGEEVTVKEWGSDYVKFDVDKELVFNIGDSAMGVTLLSIGEDSVLLDVEGDTKVVKIKDNIEDFGDVEVKLVSVFEDSGIAVMKVGAELDEKLEDGDEFVDDDNWEWKITKDSIGLVLVEDFDEDDTALKAGEKFALPGDYAAISFELDDVKYQSLDIEYKAANEIEFVGDFEDAEGDLVFNGTNFIDEDDENLGTEVFFKDSELSLSYDGTNFVIGDVTVGAQVKSINIDGTWSTYSDDDVKSEMGVVIKAPEDSLDEQELSLEIPEEAVKTTLIVE